jgi:large subunit ribosomal protein L18
MNAEKQARRLRLERHVRLRRKLSGSPSRPRLAVFRSNGHIYAQIIDDVGRQTIESASSLDIKRKDSNVQKSKIEWSTLVGTQIALRAVAKGIGRVVFDRGGYKYHGRVKALADAAREGGLSF